MISTIKRSVLGVALILFSSVPLLGHPTNGVLHLASKQIAIGGELELRGERFEKGTDMKLELRGVLDNYPIGEVKTDAAGTFQATLTLPPHVPTGAYTLVAIAPDGDITARAELSIIPSAQAAKPAMPGMPGMAAGAGMEQEMPGQHATDEMMAIDQSKSAAERIIVAVLVLASFGGGGMLLRKAALVNQSATVDSLWWTHQGTDDLPDGAGRVRGHEDADEEDEDRE